MHDKLEAQIEDVAALIELMREDHARVEATLDQASKQLTELGDIHTHAADTLRETTNKLSHALEDISTTTFSTTRMLRWFPWKLAAILCVSITIVALAVNTFWIHRYTARHQEALVELERYKALAVGLDRYMLETLYPHLSPERQGEINAVYRDALAEPPRDRVAKQKRGEQ